MTDPFDVLRQPPACDEPDDSFVERVMGEVAKRLDQPVHQEATPTRAKSDFLEVIPMHRSTRRRQPMLVAVAAIAAASALVAVVLLRDDPSTTPTRPATTTAAPSPTTTPAANVPAALQGRWMSDTRPFEPNGVGVMLKIDGSTLSLATALGNGIWLSGGVRANGEGAIVVSTRPRAAASITCAGTNDDGTYSWKLSASGRHLEITQQADRCGARSAALVGSYSRLGCIDPSDNCLGLLDAGTYGSQFIRPFQTTTSGWSPHYGGIRYTVPDGWANFTDFPDTFGVSPAKDFTATNGSQTLPAHSITVFSPSTPITGACDTPKPVLSTSLEQAVAALAATPGIAVSAPTSVTVDGHRALAVDIGRSATICPNGETNVVLYGDLTDSKRTARLDPDEKARVILVDLNDGALGKNGIQLASIWIDSLNGFGLDAFIPEAMKIIDTMHFS